MFDTNLMFWAGTEDITTSTLSGTKAVGPTGVMGITVECAIDSAAGSLTGWTVDPYVTFAATAGGTYADTAYLPRITKAADAATTGLIRVARVVQSDKRFMKGGFTLGTGTGLAISATMGIVSGPPSDAVASA